MNTPHVIKMTIVLADDHNLTRQGIRRLLEDDDRFEVIGEATDGEEAIDVTANLKPDILITDYKMPGASGTQVTKKVRELSPTTRIIVLTMFGLETYVYSVIAAGATGYVLKGSGLQNLDTAIREVYEGRIYLSPPLTKELVNAYQIRTGKPALTW